MVALMFNIKFVVIFHIDGKCMHLMCIVHLIALVFEKNIVSQPRLNVISPGLNTSLLGKTLKPYLSSSY